MTPPLDHPDRDLLRVDDDTLAERAAGGDRRALELLLGRVYDKVFRICRRLCHNEADAPDAAQEALLTLARRIDRYDGQARFSTWMYRVVTNACLDELRRVRRRPIPIDEENRAEAPDPRADPAERIGDQLRLDKAFESLGEDFRAAVVLRDVAGLDYAEIAEVLGVPIGTVRSRIARGRAGLARELGNRAGSDARPINDQREGTESGA